MFWLGALSSYCGYKESLCNLLNDGKICELKKEHKIIKELDEKVSFLAEKLLLGIFLEDSTVCFKNENKAHCTLDIN